MTILAAIIGMAVAVVTAAVLWPTREPAGNPADRLSILAAHHAYDRGRIGNWR